MIKVCVYAIAKNEMKFAARWLDSVKVADYVCVLDTGSTDGTYEFFKEAGIIVKQKKYKNFRFDVARNDSMKLIPTDADVCVCVDIDEFFEPGWIDILRANWKDGVGRARYRYTWNFNPDGSEGIVFFADKIHKNNAFKWVYPVHEVLRQTSTKDYETITLSAIQLNHRADETKSRSNYLPLLELSVQENPLDDRNVHYLGREYYFHGDYAKAIKMLKKHLSLPTANWKDERCASLRYIARCYEQLGDIKSQEEYLLKAILETNYIREPYFELAFLYFKQENYLMSAVMFNEMLKINTRYFNYMSSPVCWGSLPYDYLSLCYYYLGDYQNAIISVDEAIKLNKDERLKENRKFFINEFNKTKN